MISSKSSLPSLCAAYRTFLRARSHIHVMIAHTLPGRVNHKILVSARTRRRRRQLHPQDYSSDPRMNRESMMSYYHDVLSTSYYLSSACKEAAGPAAQPLEFPMPTVTPCARCNAIKAFDHRSGKIHEVNNVIMAPNSKHAYLVRDKLAKSAYGVIRQCVVLKQRSNHDRISSHRDVEWESTDQLVAIKVRSI